MKVSNNKITISIFLIWLFHLSAIIGIFAGHEDWFIRLTPLNLGLCFLLLVWNIPSCTIKDLLLLAIPIVIGFSAELIGVHQGWLFGHYSYGKNLGPHFLNVPLMIGINWLLLVYATSAIASRLCKNLFASSVLAALLMVLLDYFMEASAPRFDFWRFDDLIVPIRNYVAWFAVGLLAQLAFQSNFRKTSYILGLQLYLAMMIFFMSFYFIK